ncbi:hypothetical protein Tco_1564314 [Tanacetum coccineum]
MYYPRFTKVIVDYFMAKDQAIPRRNKMFWHYARDDFMFITVRVISKHQDTQVHGAILPQHLTNQAMLEFEAYMTYRAYATGEKTPKPKSTKKKVNSEPSPKTKPTQASKGKRIKTSTKGDKAAKIKQSAIKSKGDGVDIQSKVLDEQQHTISGTNEGAGDKPEVPDVPKYRSESEEESWTFSQGEDDEENDEHDSEDDNDEHDSENENDDDQENMIRKKKKKTKKVNDDDEVSSDQKVSTPPDYELTEEQENQEDDDVMGGEQEDEEDEELSSVSTDLVSKLINLTPDIGIDSILNPNVKSNIPVNVSVSVTTETPSFDTTIPQTPIPIIQPQQQTHDSTTTTTLPEIPNFASLFGFERRVSLLETELSELKQTNQFAEAVSSIPGIVDNYLASKMKHVVNVVVQLQSNKLREEAQAENDKFLKQIDSNIKAIINDQVKAQVSKIMPKVEKYVTESLGAKVLARSSNQPQTSYAAAASLSEFKLKKEDSDDQDKEMEKPFRWTSNQGRSEKRVQQEESIKEALKRSPISWHNLEGRPYPYDLSKPFPLIQNARGRQVIPFDHFINNDLEYLKGGSLSQKYTTSLTKTKAADYGHVKWIEDKVSRIYGV